MSVPDTASILLGRQLYDDEYFKAATLGWTTELLQAFFLVSDDIMDGSSTRRGKPCWYRQPRVGMIAINDAFMLEAAIFTLLKKFFRDHPNYVDLLELVHEVTFQTELGQLADLLTAPAPKPEGNANLDNVDLLTAPKPEDNANLDNVDLLTAPKNKVNLNNFNMAKYRFIVVYKTAYYSFYLPVALALYQLGLATPENLKTAEDILIPMGEYFQVQDDYLDNFGDPKRIGKIGTDIKEGKCSWLVIQALQNATPDQRKILEDNYGREGEANEAVIKKLYDDLELKDKYKEYEEEVAGDGKLGKLGELRVKISKIDESKGLKKEVFSTFLDKIYKRSN